MRIIELPLTPVQNLNFDIIKPFAIYLCTDMLSSYNNSLIIHNPKPLSNDVIMQLSNNRVSYLATAESLHAANQHRVRAKLWNEIYATKYNYMQLQLDYTCPQCMTCNPCIFCNQCGYYKKILPDILSHDLEDAIQTIQAYYIVIKISTYITRGALYKAFLTKFDTKICELPRLHHYIKNDDVTKQDTVLSGSTRYIVIPCRALLALTFARLFRDCFYQDVYMPAGMYPRR